MTLKEGDLKNTLLKKFGVDEFEPKTGDIENVMVVSFFVIQNTPGQDLYHYLNDSVIDIRDIEVSPNPNEDNYYLVFVEIDRTENSINDIKELLREVERLAGKLRWEFKTNLTPDYVPFDDESAEKFIQQTPGEFKSKEEKEAEEAMEEQRRIEAEQLAEAERVNPVYEFLQRSDLLAANLDENTLRLGGSAGVVTLEYVNFGDKEIMDELGINESAVEQEYDLALFSKLSSILGEMKAIPISEYVVIFHPDEQKVLVTKPC